jgi:hypothetical protein
VGGVERAPPRKGQSEARRRPRALLRRASDAQAHRTAFSRIASTPPKQIHAVTLGGFPSKVSVFVIAFAPDEAFIQQLGGFT